MTKDYDDIYWINLKPTLSLTYKVRLLVHEKLLDD